MTRVKAFSSLSEKRRKMKKRKKNGKRRTEVSEGRIVEGGRVLELARWHWTHLTRWGRVGD